jgi:hypothetical protein
MASTNLVDKFIEQVQRKKLDGFFLLPENSGPLKTSELIGAWDHCTYSVRGGKLYLSPKAYKKYGYPDEKAFADDLTTIGVLASTFVGGLSLGPARFLESTGIYLLMDEPDCWRMSYPMADEGEAMAAKAFLMKMFPKARFRLNHASSLGLISYAQGISIPRYWTWLQSAPRAVRKAAVGAGVCAVLSLLTSFTFFVHRNLEWACWLCVGAFYMAFFDYIRQTHRWNNRGKDALPG